MTRFFVTVDAETDVIPQGVDEIARLRDRVERETGLAIPIVWFVRFQRPFSEYVDHDDPAFFERRTDRLFDGPAVGGTRFHALQQRGDEIGWHYHAYNYVYRDDLDHATRVAILDADMSTCAAALRERHPGLDVRSFRFGWFFVPDYGLYKTLARLGIAHDASIRLDGRSQVAGTATTFLPPITSEPAMVGGVACYPFRETLITHDWEVVPHDLGWSRRDDEGARRAREALARGLSDTAARLQRRGGGFSTYRDAPRIALPQVGLGA